jgi:ketosteroid isomerase-like protein
VSAENAEVVRRALSPPFLSTSTDQVAELFDPAVRLELSERVFNPGVYERYDGIHRWQQEVGDVWESYRLEPEGFVDGDDVVVAITRERARGKGSGVEVDRQVTFLCRLRDHRVSEIRFYIEDRDRALRDAGLHE